MKVTVDIEAARQAITYPTLFRHKLTQAIWLCLSETTGVRLSKSGYRPQARTPEVKYSENINTSDDVWEILPVGTTVIITQE